MKNDPIETKNEYIPFACNNKQNYVVRFCGPLYTPSIDDCFTIDGDGCYNNVVAVPFCVTRPRSAPGSMVYSMTEVITPPCLNDISDREPLNDYDEDISLEFNSSFNPSDFNDDYDIPESCSSYDYRCMLPY